MFLGDLTGAEDYSLKCIRIILFTRILRRESQKSFFLRERIMPKFAREFYSCKYAIFNLFRYTCCLFAKYEI
jgi:hypothetical protein